MKEEIWILIDKNAGKDFNYVGVHKYFQAAKHHLYFRELKMKQKGTFIIKKAHIDFINP
jgi:hypothetical protein